MNVNEVRPVPVTPGLAMPSLEQERISERRPKDLADARSDRRSSVA